MSATISTIPVAAERHFGFIDGMRAIAILLVVGHHVGIPYFAGGYVGVDIFFVISGFLIIGMINKAVAAGTFSFADFWARRVLRILPAYLLVIVVSTIIGLVVLVLPGEFKDFGWSIAASGGMGANLLFLSQEGYFNGAASTKPLLHLWSLGVEEQFYLFAPVLIVGLTALGRRIHRPEATLLNAGIVMFAASLAGCVMLTAAVQWNLSFYLMPLRAWEFMAGGAIGLLAQRWRKLPRRLATLIGIGGLGVLVLSVLLLSDRTPFPSYNVIFPVAGAVALILSGLVHPDGPVPRLLASRPAKAIGLISYAWYLWHWPLLVFARTVNFGVFNFRTALVMAGLSLGLAVLTHWLVERPILRWRKSRPARLGWRVVILGLASTAIVAGLGVGVAKVAAGRAEQALSAGMPKLPQLPAGCQLGKATTPSDCVPADFTGRIGIIIGDSHAERLTPTLLARMAAPDAIVTALYSSACGPLLGIVQYERDIRDPRNCHPAIENFERLIDSGEFAADYAIIFARWAVYAHDDTTPSGDFKVVLKPADESRAAGDQKALFIAGLREMIEKLRLHGTGRILLIGPTPEFGRHVFNCVGRADHYGVPRDAACSVARSIVEEREAVARVWLTEALAGLEEVRVIEPVPVMCDDQLCRAWTDDGSMYEDSNHLNPRGGLWFYDQFAADFDWVSAAE